MSFHSRNIVAARRSGFKRLAAGARVIYVGDSIFAQGSSAINSPFSASYSLPEGEVSWANVFDPRFRVDDFWDAGRNQSWGSNQGVGGNTPANVLARVSAFMVTNPDVVILNIGTNGLASGAAAQFATTQSIIDTIRAISATVPIVLGTIRATASSKEGTNPRATIQALNALIRTYVPTQKRMWLWDAYADYDQGDGYGNASWYGDGLHPLALRTQVAGQSLSAVLAQIVAPGNVYDSLFAGNILANGLLTGAAGSKGSGITNAVSNGGLATSWSASITSGNTATVAKEANAETGGETQIFTVTPAGTGTTASLAIGPSNGNIGSSALANLWMRGYVEIEYDGWAGWRIPTFEMSEQNTTATAFTRAMYVSSVSTYIGGARRLHVGTLPKLNHATTTFMGSGTITLPFDPAAAGTGVARLRRAVMATVADPTPLYG